MIESYFVLSSFETSYLQWTLAACYELTDLSRARMQEDEKCDVTSQVAAVFLMHENKNSYGLLLLLLDCRVKVADSYPLSNLLVRQIRSESVNRPTDMCRTAFGSSSVNDRLAAR